MVRCLGCGVTAAFLLFGSAAVARPDDEGGLPSAVFAEVNWVRAHPAEYAEQLRAAPQTATTREAIAFLERHAPAPPLAFNAGLGFSAALHATDEGRHGEFEHTGTDGSSAGERMQRAGVWAGMLAEEMAAGEDRAEDVVRALIVDEGVPDRGHRKDLMDPFLRRAGVGCASHPVYGVICVIDLASAAPR